MTTTAQIEAAVRLATKLSPEDARLVADALERAERLGYAEGYRAGKESVPLRRHGVRPGSPRWNRIYNQGGAA